MDFGGLRARSAHLARTKFLRHSSCTQKTFGKNRFSRLFFLTSKNALLENGQCPPPHLHGIKIPDDVDPIFRSSILDPRSSILDPRAGYRPPFEKLIPWRLLFCLDDWFASTSIIHFLRIPQNIHAIVIEYLFYNLQPWLSKKRLNRTIILV